ncbi:amidohydrolase [Sedimentibacter sp. zth1]|uniref:amidohydrolase n=1 Tax=Sedimentibacter sp. zth1 TaxID=2816908 RepID=UPI001A91F3A4|nr:amidohydrolase [Sedimentibacter sp. zth1]QSX06071.1 amidohydrolase [Sedimentibacter sp. zth1]
MLIIKNADLINMSDICHENKDILIEDSKIKEIGNIDVSKYENAKVIDAKGKLVTPGLVDPHCHVGLFQDIVGDAGSDGNEMTSPIVPEVRGIDSVKPHDPSFEHALNSGVTTVVTGPGSGEIIGGTFCALKTYGKTIFDMVLKEEVAMKMALGENPKRVFGSQNKAPSTRMGNAASMREALFKAKEYYEKKKEYEKQVASGKEDAKKPEFSMKWESLSRVFDGMIVKIHAHQEDDITTALRIIEEFKLNATIDHCTSGWKIPEVLKERNQKVIIGPTFGTKTKIELKDKSFEAGRVMYENGIMFGIMTDHPVVPLENTTTQAGLFVKNGLPWIEALKALTINAAKVTGIDDRVGSIEVGKDADIVIWSGDPFHYMSKAETVVLNGKVVVEN